MIKNYDVIPELVGIAFVCTLLLMLATYVILIQGEKDD